MKYKAHENIPHGWEITDMSAIPPRTFVVGLTKEQADQILAELKPKPRGPRKIFPREGIYAVVGGLPSSHFMDAEDEKRFRYIMPAHPDMDDEQARLCWLADCWIVDKDGKHNPGTSACAVPINIASIGRRVS